MTGLATPCMSILLLTGLWEEHYREMLNLDDLNQSSLSLSFHEARAQTAAPQGRPLCFYWQTGTFVVRNLALDKMVIYPRGQLGTYTF